jgi:hypothetical protein
MDDDDMTPAWVIRQNWRWLPAWTIVLITVLAVGGLVTWGGSEFGWWLNGEAAKHQAVTTQDGYANQTALRAQVTSLLAQVATITTQIAEADGDQSVIAALKPQRMAIASQACSDAAQVTDGPLPSDQAQWAAVNCASGSVSPSSPLYQAGQP